MEDSDSVVLAFVASVVSVASVASLASVASSAPDTFLGDLGFLGFLGDLTSSTVTLILTSLSSGTTPASRADSSFVEEHAKNIEQMENRIAAPESGVLAQIDVKEGSSVQAGTSLVQMHFSSL